LYAPDLRGTGETKPARGGYGVTPDHNSAEHAVWIGRPLLGQWLVDVRAVLGFMAKQPGLLGTRLAVIGLGQAGLVALCAAGLFPERVASVVAAVTPASFLTDQAYPAGTRMGLLAPGILRAGDVPHLAALSAPRKLVLAGAAGKDGKKLDAKGMSAAFGFTEKIYRLLKAGASLKMKAEMTPAEVAAAL
jgi:pimeloyl-ACP methyl ester carboxylesterase